MLTLFFRYSILLSTLIVCAAKASLGEMTQTPEVLQFGGQKYCLAFDKSNNTISTQEYLLENENRNNWSELVAIRFCKGFHNCRESINQVYYLLKTEYPEAAEHATIECTDSESMIDFFIDNQDFATFEYNILRNVDTAQGVVTYQFIIRTLKTNASENQFKTMIAQRQLWTLMKETPFPSISL